MTRLFLLVLVASGATACASPLYGPRSFHPPYGAGLQTGVAANLDPWRNVVGRWDNIIALPPGAVLGVIAADGGIHTGAYTKAGLQWLRILENGVEVELLRKDVARIDLVQTPKAGVDTDAVMANAAKGALALGGMMTAVPYFLTGDVHVPPGRFWALGAILGGAASVQRQRETGRGRTLYLSPELIGQH